MASSNREAKHMKESGTVLENLTVLRSEPITGRSYEWVSARADYAVSLSDPGTARIADIDLAPCDADGKIRFSGDVVLLRPTGGGNVRALVVVPNRGMAALPFARPSLQLGGTREPIAVTDGHLLDPAGQSRCRAGSGDGSEGFVGLEAPVAEVEPG
jgi:hypothetical protein